MAIFNCYTLIATIIFAQICRVHSRPSCPPCHIDNSCEPVVSCEYEIVTDHCGRKVCSKGPGERCGGMYNFFGACAKGLHCKCSRCNGCAVKNLKCSSHESILCYFP